MSNYNLNINDYELTLLKNLVYDRKHLLQQKTKECPDCVKEDFYTAYKAAENLLIRLVKLSGNNPNDFYNYDLLQRKDKSYNEYIKEYFNG